MIRRVRDDAGAALVMAMVMGAILVIVLGAVYNRGLSQAGNAAGDRCWEAALDNAESALNWGLAQIDDDSEFHSGSDTFDEMVGSADERSAVLAAADTAAQLLSSGTGDGVFLRAAGSTVVHAVGYCPGRDDPGRTARVIRVALGTDSGQAIDMAYAFLSGSDLEVSGNPTFHGAASSVHANALVTVSGSLTFQGGCVTATGGGTVSGQLNIHAVCLPASQRFSQPPVEMPATTARDVWPLSEYDLCPDGSVRAGPAHPTHGAGVGVVPCSGHVLAVDATSIGYRDWERPGDTWTYTGNQAAHGAYYVYRGSALVSSSPGSTNNPWRVLIAAEGNLECPAMAGGDVTITGSLVVAPYWTGLDVLGATYSVVADRDVIWSGNGQLTEPALVLAGEQIRLSGNPTVSGSFVARSGCHTPGSPVSATQISGNPTVRLDSPLEVGDGGGFGPITGVTEWTEVR